MIICAGCGDVAVDRVDTPAALDLEQAGEFWSMLAQHDVLCNSAAGGRTQAVRQKP